MGEIPGLNGQHQRFAVIDLGTNTFNLLIAEPSGDQLNTLVKQRIPVKLLEDSLDGSIQPIPFDRGQRALGEHMATIAEWQVMETQAVATSALRTAANAKHFLHTAWELHQLPIRVIDGQEEAALIHNGAQRALDIGSAPELIMDIGGGSTEFVLANSNGLLWKESFPIGVARLKGRFQKNDPITPEECSAIFDHLDDLLQPLKEAHAQWPASSLIGTAGSFSSLAQMISRKKTGQPFPAEQTTYDFELADLYVIHQKVLQSTLAQRLQIPGLVQYRADMMVVASLIIQWVVERLAIERVRLATYALREGVLFEMAADQGRSTN